MIARIRKAVDDGLRFLAAENRAAAANWTSPDVAADRRLLGLVAVAALALLALHYLVVNGGNGLPALLWQFGLKDAARSLHAAFTDAESGRFTQMLVWALGTVLVFLVLPALYLRATGGRLADYGLRWARGHAQVYLLLFLLLLPLVIGAATMPGFSTYYPFFRPAPGEPLWPRFVIWEAAYLMQFLAVEFFFRGALIHAARHRFGAWSILLPLLPYMMIHFGKPPAEAAGSVAAGLVLGYLSLRTGSIAFGVLLHGGVAITMDIAALAMTGRLY